MTRPTRPKDFFIIITTSKCTDPSMQALEDSFLERRLSPSQQIEFERHRHDCYACNVMAKNAETMCAASRHFGVPIGKELAPYLTLIPALRADAGEDDRSRLLIADCLQSAER